MEVCALRIRTFGALARLVAVVVGAGLAAGCTRPEAPPPDVLVVVWDTVRADRLSAYGYARPTTPWLEGLAAEGVRFDCLAPGSNTIATHGSLFTGLAPSEHGATFRNRRLPDDHGTLAERLADAGYATYLYSANPSVSALTGFDQGFEAVEHPWDPKREAAAREALAAKVADGDAGTGFRGRLERGTLGGFDLSSTGELAAPALAGWFEDRARTSDRRPAFAVVNLMEAHYPLLPARAARERLMGPDELRASYALRRTWSELWRHVAGVEPLGPEELALGSALYDAALAELDLHTEALVEAFEAGLGPERAARAVVVVTSDHGEHLGEAYGGVSWLDHRYALHDELLRVPLVVRAPGRLAPDGGPRPAALVTDLFPTLLAWAGAEPPEEWGAAPPRRLDRPAPADGPRTRIAEYLDDFGPPLEPRFLDPERWAALGLEGRRTVVRRAGAGLERSDGDLRTFRVRSPWPVAGPAGSDPAPLEPGVRAALEAALERFEAERVPHPALGGPAPPLSAEQRAMLERLGYGQVEGGG